MIFRWMGGYKVLRSYAVEDLRAGMKIGRDVLANGSVLYGKGTVLTDADIVKISGSMLFSVYIDEDEEQADERIEGIEYLLDDDYVNCYEKTMARIQRIYNKLVKDETLDMNELNVVLSDDNIQELCDGAKAVSQIHNMSRDGDTVLHHVMHVGILAGLMGNWMRMPKERMRDLVMSAFLHDVGKKCIPDEILNKQGKLTDEEFHEIRKHPEYGYNLLKLGPLKAKNDVLFGIVQHHERCDGSGYPGKLKKDQINELARIIAILDIYDAMAANRSYARRCSPFDILGVLYEDVLNGKLDTEFGVYFMRHLCQSLNGNWVALTNGQKARIVYIDGSRVKSLPVVQTTKNEFIDLNRRSDIKIQAVLTAREMS